MRNDQLWFDNPRSGEGGGGVLPGARQARGQRVRVTRQNPLCGGVAAPDCNVPIEVQSPVGFPLIGINRNEVIGSCCEVL